MVMHHKETGFARYEKGVVEEAIHRVYEKVKKYAEERARDREERWALRTFENAVWWHKCFWRWVSFGLRTLPVKVDVPDEFFWYVDHETQQTFEELLALVATCDDTHVLLSPAAVRYCELDPEYLAGRLKQ